MSGATSLAKFQKQNVVTAFTGEFALVVVGRAVERTRNENASAPIKRHAVSKTPTITARGAEPVQRAAVIEFCHVEIARAEGGDGCASDTRGTGELARRVAIARGIGGDAERVINAFAAAAMEPPQLAVCVELGDEQIVRAVALDGFAAEFQRALKHS